MPVDFGQSWPQRLQIISGLILFTFVFFHFINLTFGLISLDLMLWFQQVRQVITRSPLGSIVLGAALLTHMGLVLYRLARRSSLKMPLWEWIRILFGFTIPFLLIPHVAKTRGVNILNNTNDDYLYVLPNLWPELSWQQSILLLIVWVHACIGLHYWLRINAWYRASFMPLFALAVALPILSVAGFSVAGPEAKQRVIANLVAQVQAQMEVDAKAETAARTAPANPYDGDKKPAQNTKKSWFETLTPLQLEEYSRNIFVLALFGTLGIFTVKYGRRKFGEQIEIDYKSVRKLRTHTGSTLLEISRENNIPHASQCGGRARCSTCRVRILAGGQTLPSPGKDEAATLARIKAGPDVRLACQIRPDHDLELVQLVRPNSAIQTPGVNSQEDEGVERNVAVMFIDVRGFTRMSSEKLPYDVVYILNALFEAIGEVIKEQDGWIDKYLGDGLMAIFGRDDGPVSGMHHALQAAAKIDLVLEQVNETLASELKFPLKIGIGIHAGPLVLGRIGHRDSASLTVIGTTVNTAARLEAMTKDKGVQLILSQVAAEYGGLEMDGFEVEDVNVRGIAEPVAILSIKCAREAI
jgi:adenylate cyclase